MAVPPSEGADARNWLGPLPTRCSSSLGSTLRAMEESEATSWPLHNEQAWLQGPGETVSRIDAGGLGHQSVGSQPAGMGEESSDNSLVFLCVLPLGRNSAFCSWSGKFLGAQG